MSRLKLGVATWVLWVLAACATAQVANHALSWDVPSDSPGVELLDYRYGDSNDPGTSNSPDRRARGTAPQAFIVSGPIRRGETLYAKWKVKDTGAIFEDTANLRGKLPADMDGYRVHFVVRGSQLFVYLVSPDPRPANLPPNGPSRFHARVVTTLHPENNVR